MALHEIDKEVAASICCVAYDISDYITKALRIGQDKTYRQKVSSAIMQQNYRIFDDSQTSFEWARFLTRALGVVLDTNELSIKMNYVPKTWQVDSFLQYEFIHAQQQWKLRKMEEAVLR